MPDRRGNIQREPLQQRQLFKPREWRLIVVSLEGEKREYDYFSHLISLFHVSSVKVHLLPTSGGLSQPEHIVERLELQRTELDIQPEDEYWLVFDVDDRSHERMLSLLEEMTKKRIRSAISNPCFEFWLFLHKLEVSDIGADIHALDADKRPKQMKDILNSRLSGYQYSRLPAGELLIEIRDAVARAKKLRAGTGRSYPAMPGTDVHLVVSSILRHVSRIQSIIS